MTSNICFAVAAAILLDSALRRADFFSPFRLYLFFHALTFGVANLRLHEAMTPLRPVTLMVYLGSGAGFLAATWMVGAIVKMIPREERPESELDKSGYNWKLHFRFALLAFLLFLGGMLMAYGGAGGFPLLAEDKADVLKKFMGYHWVASFMMNFSAITMALFFMAALGKRNRIFGMNAGLWLLVATVAVFLLAMSRSSLIFLVFFGLVYYNYYAGRIPVVRLSLVGAMVLSLFLGIAYLRLSSFQKEHQISGVSAVVAAKLMFSFPYIYVANNFWNLDYGLNPENYELRHQTTYGFTTLSGFFDMMYTGSHWGPEFRESMGYESIYHEKTQKVKGLNTVAYQWGLYKDFGVLGTIFIPFLFGIAISILYWKIRLSPNIMNIALYAYFAYFVGFSWFLAFWESQVYVYSLMYLALCVVFCQYSGKKGEIPGEIVRQ